MTLSLTTLCLEAVYHVSLSLQTPVLDIFSYFLGHITHCFVPSHLIFISRSSAIICCSHLPCSDDSSHCPSNFILVFLFYHQLWFSLLSLSISPHSVSVRVLPTHYLHPQCFFIPIFVCNSTIPLLSSSFSQRFPWTAQVLCFRALQLIAKNCHIC